MPSWLSDMEIAELTSVRSKTTLERLHRLAEGEAHAVVGRRSTGSASGKCWINRAPIAAVGGGGGRKADFLRLP